ncbi:MAG: AAA family ATPase [Candidatus Asgardarchaeia archaeon]
MITTEIKGKKKKFDEEKTKISLKFNNWGPIYKGEFEIKPFTVLIGANNTGKSYSAMTYYAIVKGIKKALFPWLSDIKDYMRNESPEDVDVLKEEIYKEQLEKLAYKDNFDDVIQEVGFYSIDLSKKWLLVYLNKRKDVIVQEIERVFSSNIEELISFNKQAAKVVFTAKDSHLSFECIIQIVRKKVPDVSLKLDFTKEKDKLKKMIEEGFYETISKSIESSKDYQDILIKAYFFSDVLNDIMKFGKDIDFKKIWSTMSINSRMALIRKLVAYFKVYVLLIMSWMDNLLGNVFYLPASRSGILQGHKIIASALVSTYPLAITKGINIPKFPGYVADFLSELLKIGEERSLEPSEDVRRISNELLEKIEKTLSGMIKIKKFEDYGISELVYTTLNGNDVPVSRTSSMISELAPLYLYLKFVVNQEDTLIIEEPESHVHQDIQAKLATILANLVNQEKLKLIITTHSDVFISKINNLISLSHLSIDEYKALGYSIIDVLRPDIVGAYLYKKYKDQLTIIEKLDITDEGIPDEIFTKIIESLYEETMNIYYRLQKIKLGSSKKDQK